MASRAIAQNGLTHAGVFHADEVFATALLLTIDPSIHITRANTVPAGFEGIVYDIGGGEFDHHVGALRYRENGVPYSSFGLLWERFGRRLLPPEDAARFDVELVQPIDLTDNTGEQNPLSTCVGDFNPQDARSASDFDDAFWEAVSWAKGVIERKLSVMDAERAHAEYLHERMEACDGRVLVLDRGMRWRTAVVGSGYVFVVYPSPRSGYNVQGVPVSMEGQELVKAFPREWWGRPAPELRAMTGVDGVMFCHLSGYLCAAESKEDALRLADLAIQGEVPGGACARRG